MQLELETIVQKLVGEVLVAGFDGLTVTQHATTLVKTHGVKNIILFSRNVESPAQLRALTDELQALALSADDPPLLICTDQENGIVRRLGNGYPGLPGNMAVGATGDPDYAYQIGGMTARQLQSAGITMNLAPVLDINNNPQNPVIGVRAYSEQPDQVAEFGVAMCKGLQDNGVIACGKHFPGHGDTADDSHLSLPCVSHSMARMEAVELQPFRRAIDAKVEVLMSAHIVFPQVEPDELPATLSKRVLTHLLRDTLQFRGVITTDCMEMNAIADTYGVGEGAILAILAGADLIMVSHHLARQEEAIAAITQATLSGRIPLARLQEAADRVRRLRKSYRPRPRLSAQEELTLLQDAQTLQATICQRAVTIVANTRNMLPLTHPDCRVTVLRDRSAPHMSAADPLQEDPLITALQAQESIAAYEVIDFTVLPADKVESVQRAVQAYGSHALLAIVNGTANSAYLECLRAIARTAMPLVLLVLQSPYDLSAIVEAHTAVTLYENTPWMIRAGLAAIKGNTNTTGRLPVSLSAQWPAGTGLSC